MKIDFGTYYYYDPDSGDNNTYNGKSNGRVNDESLSSFAFNEKQYREYLDKKQYTEAYRYASKFHFVDDRKQQELERMLLGLKSKGPIAEQVYSRIPEKDRAAVDFADMVGTDRGLELISNNDFTKQFVSLKEELGGKESTKLAIRFDKKQRSLFGWDALDFLKKDNPFGYEDYLKGLNIDETTLRQNGVKIEVNKDGSTTLIFDKTNPYANKLIYAIPHRGISGKVWDTIMGYDPLLSTHTEYLPDNPYTIIKNLISSPLHNQLLERKDVNGTPLGDDAEYGIHITGLKTNQDGKDEEVSSDNNGSWTLRRIKSLIKGAKETKEQYSKVLNFEDKQYSSIVGPVLNMQIDDLLEQGLDENEALKQLKIINQNWNDFISTAGWQNYDIYTGYFNDAETNTALSKVEDEIEKEDLMSKLAANSKDLRINLMIASNGKAGILVTLDRVKKEAKNLFELSKEKRVQVFIPDDGRSAIFNQVREKLNSDPRLTAANEINMMQDWGYVRDLTANSGSLQYGGINSNTERAEFIYQKGANKEKISKEEAEHLIARDNFVEHFKNNIIHQFVTSDNRIVSTPENPAGGGALAYEELTRNAAITTATNLYQGVPWTYADNTPITKDDINRFLWTDDEDFRRAWLANFNDEQSRMLIDMLLAYKTIFSSLKPYGIFNVEQLGLR